MASAIDLLMLLTLVSDQPSAASSLRGPARRGLALCPEEVPRYRSLSCPEYDHCLDAASRKGWMSWTCEDCRLFPLAAVFRSFEVASTCAERPQADYA